MPRGKSTQDSTLLSMALVGYEAERQKIDEKIRELRQQLGARGNGPATKKSSAASTSSGGAEQDGRKRRTLSAAARKRIAAAQKKRWAEHRKTLAAS